MNNKIIIILLFVSLMLSGCQKPVKKANDLIHESSRFSFIGNVSKVDSIFGYEDSYNTQCSALYAQWGIDSTLQISPKPLSDSLREDLLELSNMVYKLKLLSAKLEMQHGFERKEKTFVGYYADKDINMKTYRLYFDEDMKKILGCEEIKSMN